MSEVSVPTAQELGYPTVVAIRDLGGSARIDEISEQVVENLSLTEEQQAVPQGGADTRSKLEYRLAWARTLGKNLGALENSERGVWRLTDLGKTLEEERFEALREEYLRTLRSAKGKDDEDDRPADDDAGSDLAAIDEPEDAWVAELLDVIMAMDPYAVERLFLRLLREAGFDDLQHTGGSGDGGIDGTGVYRISLVSFRVYFQCKRYKGTVGPGDVRDFRGAMEGRGERGLLVTTSSFTGGAKDEATRAGAKAIDLIDGRRLCELLAEFGIGVTTVEKKSSEVTVEREFFTTV